MSVRSSTTAACRAATAEAAADRRRRKTHARFMDAVDTEMKIGAVRRFFRAGAGRGERVEDLAQAVEIQSKGRLQSRGEGRGRSKLAIALARTFAPAAA